MGRIFDARHLDVKTFAQEGGAVAGQEPLRRFPRLLAETQGRGAETPIEWSASGEMRNPLHHSPQIWLHLKASAKLSLTCQRCLMPVDVPVTIDRSFRFVADEAVAAAEDEESEEDVLELSRSFDVPGLIEDEMLMELPISPRHDTCPPVRVVVQDKGFDEAPAERENPFAVLGRLKTPKDG